MSNFFFPLSFGFSIEIDLFSWKQGKILFGILLRYEDSVKEGEDEIVEEKWLQVGQGVYPSVD